MPALTSAQPLYYCRSIHHPKPLPVIHSSTFSISNDAMTMTIILKSHISTAYSTICAVKNYLSVKLVWHTWLSSSWTHSLSSQHRQLSHHTLLCTETLKKHKKHDLYINFNNRNPAQHHSFRPFSKWNGSSWFCRLIPSVLFLRLLQRKSFWWVANGPHAIPVTHLTMSKNLRKLKALTQI